MKECQTASRAGVQVLHCPDCFYMSLSLPKMCEHFFTHQESVEWQIFRCNHCTMISSHEELLDEHLALQHPDKDATKGKKLLIDSLFIPQLPDNYSVEAEMRPLESYSSRYCCPFCEVVVTDKEVFRTHLELIHSITHVSSVKSFRAVEPVTGMNLPSNAEIVQSALCPSVSVSIVPSPSLGVIKSTVTTEHCFNYVPSYKSLKQEERVSTVMTVAGGAVPPVALSPATDELLARTTRPRIESATLLQLCPASLEPEIAAVSMERAVLRAAYDPEPLRFLRNLVRAGIPLPELVAFSWKGNRRGRPRHLDTQQQQAAVSSAGGSQQRRSMKDDLRMRAYCQLVQNVTGKSLPDNLGTHMHQFLSNLRNKSALM